MKYYLAVDKGDRYRDNERYVKLDLTLINSKLSENNNLRAIDVFTEEFDNERELKHFLKEQKLLDKSISYFALSILYVKNGYKTLLVPYKKDGKYFDIEFMSEVIANEFYLTNMMNVFLNYFKAEDYKSESYHQLRSVVLRGSEKYIVYDRIRKFLDDYCKPTGKISAGAFHRVAMLVSRIHQSSGTPEVTPLDKNESPVLSDAQRFHLEELQSRVQNQEDDDQLNLFKM